MSLLTRSPPRQTPTPMCGRFTLHHSTEDVAERFAVEQTLLELTPRYNIAPSQPVPVIIQRDGRLMREHAWGLVPFWAKDPATGNRMINARAESLVDKPTFKRAFSVQRCLIPASGYYEWKKADGGKNPHYIQAADGQPFAMAGLFEKWSDPDGLPLRTCAVITTEPNELAAAIHNRMPAILTHDAEEIWLDPETRPEALLAVLRPYPGELSAHAVSRLVNKAATDEAACIEPAAEPQKDLQLGLPL